MYSSNYYDWYRQNDKLIRDIEKAINPLKSRYLTMRFNRLYRGLCHLALV
ncbi:Ferritin/ribonucleotide reductase-like protein [Bacillus cereus]|nr:Ferritin/ribonucleotide reductase-like protein [Bacillus cereus]